MSDCITWPGKVTAEGYVSVWLDGRPQLAHRLVYEERHGPIPPGLHIDHVCRNRACLNPDHLEAVTIRENILRGIGPAAVNHRKTHCIHGHPFDEANTFFYRSSWGGVGRGCRTCSREAMLRWRRKQAPSWQRRAQCVECGGPCRQQGRRCMDCYRASLKRVG